MMNDFKKISINNLDKAISYCYENNIDYVILNSNLSKQIEKFVQTNDFDETLNSELGKLYPAFKIDKLKFFNSPLILWEDLYLHIYKNNKIINKINVFSE